MSQVGEAFVVVRPLVQDFRAQVAAAVNTNLRSTTIPLPVTPAIPSGAKVTWETLASGAAIPRVIPLPVQPTITPAAKAAFTGEVGGLRGALLGGGQFAASRALGISGLAAGLFVFGKAAVGAVKSAATLEQELNVFQQVSGATADQMARVREEARKLGADVALPAVSAGDAAATMTELAKAGLSVDEVLQGTRGTLQLATAANLDFASATELAANALNSFQLPGSQAVKIADLLAGAANAAQGDIGDFGQALTQAGAVAHQAGLSVQQTVTFLTELAKAGIQGSDAGTSLRVALLRLIAPTKEANDIFKALGIEINDAAGNVRVDVFEQLRRSMLNLEPATRNAALATIFGTDAIRSAAIFTREGAAGFAAMERQVSRAGQAQEAADARTKGLSGSVSGLSSNIETLGADVGKLAIPALTLLADVMSDIVKHTDDALVSTENFAKKAAKAIGDLGTDLGHSRVGGFFARVSGELLDAADSARRAEDAFLHLKGATAGTAPGVSPLAFPNLKGFAGAGDRSSPQLDRAAAEAGKRVGKAFTKGAADEIDRDARDVIAAARRTVHDAQDALLEVIAAGKRSVSDAQRSLREIVAEGGRAIEDSAVQAKQNLAQIGQGLAAQVTDLLDSGPLAQRIESLQDRINRSRAAIERGNLQRSLRDASDELARAEAQVAAPRSALERAGAETFLTPFREKVKDAQAALEEFNTQGSIDKLRARLDAQKARLQKTLDDLIARFNAGLLSGTDVNARVAALLQRNVGPMGKAGEAQGFAFRQAFAAQVAALQAQIAEIIGGPQTRKTGAEPAVVSPAGVAAQTAQRISDAQRNVKDATVTAGKNNVAATRNVKDAILGLHKAQTAAVTGPDGTNEILRDIRRQLGGGKNGVKPSADVKTPKKPVRAGGPR